MDVIVEHNRAIAEQVQALGWAIGILVFFCVAFMSILVGTLSFYVYKDKQARDDANKRREDHVELVNWVRDALHVELQATRSSLDRSTLALERIAESSAEQSRAFAQWQESHREIAQMMKEMARREANIENQVATLPCHQQTCLKGDKPASQGGFP